MTVPLPAMSMPPAIVPKLMTMPAVLPTPLLPVKIRTPLTTPEIVAPAALVTAPLDAGSDAAPGFRDRAEIGDRAGTAGADLDAQTGCGDRPTGRRAIAVVDDAAAEIEAAGDRPVIADRASAA